MYPGKRCTQFVAAVVVVSVVAAVAAVVVSVVVAAVVIVDQKYLVSMCHCPGTRLSQQHPSGVHHEKWSRGGTRMASQRRRSFAVRGTMSKMSYGTN